jgi:hypothetical protein
MIITQTIDFTRRRGKTDKWERERRRGKPKKKKKEEGRRAGWSFSHTHAGCLGWAARRLGGNRNVLC